MYTIRDWFRRHLNNPQVTGLAILLLLGVGALMMVGDVLAPVLASIVIAYLLQSLVQLGQRHGLGHGAAVGIVFTLFMAILAWGVFWLMPMLVRQGAQLLDALPGILRHGRAALEDLVRAYPLLLPLEDGDDPTAQLNALSGVIEAELRSIGARALQSVSLASLVTLLSLIIYAVLVPFMVFFFLKDKDVLMRWGSRFMPRDRALVTTVWHDVDEQIGNYVRGKLIEILIVAGVTSVTFALFGLPFAMLLGAMVGLSVIVPYVGATVVTIPVAIIAYFQFGASATFAWVMVSYLIIQMLDGNVLVPLLFSEAVNLHPLAIIVAILMFGGLWGIWGVFFAIPLATLIQAILKAWPSGRGASDAPADSELDTQADVDVAAGQGDGVREE